MSNTQRMARAAKSDRAYKYLTALISGSALVFIFIISIILFPTSYPSFVVNGLKFFTTTVWNPSLSGHIIIVDGFKTMSGSSYGLLVALEGTLLSSALAILFGVPAGLGVALFLTRIAPKKIATPISFLVELLAGIPSVIYGFWGIIVLGPFLLNYLEPQLAAHLSFIPIFKPPIYSYGVLASGLILAVMIVPIIAAISRDVMAQTPIEQLEGAKALGLTNWEITRKIVLPFSKTGIFGAVILGLGRALGETMAVAMVCGAARLLPQTAFYSLNTLAATMALSLDSAFLDPTQMYVHALFELAVVLLIITMIVNILARALVRQGFIRNAEGAVRV